MKISLFLLISTIICLYFSQAPTNSTTTPAYTTEETITKTVNDSNKATRPSMDDTDTKTTDTVLDQTNNSSGETEEYLNFVRKQMKESIREHLQNIQEKLGEEYDEKTEKLILL